MTVLVLTKVSYFSSKPFLNTGPCNVTRYFILHTWTRHFIFVEMLFLQFVVYNSFLGDGIGKEYSNKFSRFSN